MVESTVLSCGLTLVTEKMPEVRSACIGFWVGTGSRDERPTEAGLSHFLEHLLFKGTPQRSARAIAEETDAVGGDLNAYTTKEYTTFYMRLLGEDLDLALDILSDIIWSPALRPDEVDAERQVILEEVLMHRDEPSDVVYERFSEAAFPGHPLGREVLGLPEVIERVRVEELRAFLERHYRPGNIIVAAAGDVDHEPVAKGLDERFAGLPGGEPPSREPPGGETRPLDVTARDTEQAQIVLGMRALSHNDPDRYALLVLNHVLGGGLSSRLFQKVREERGLCYSIGSDRISYSDAGLLSVSVGTSPDHAKEVLSLIGSELDALRRDGISDRELELAVAHVRADTMLSLEDSGARMSRLGAGLLLHGEVHSPEESIRRIGAVTRKDVSQVIDRVLSAPPVLAIVGPFDEGSFSGALG